MRNSSHALGREGADRAKECTGRQNGRAPRKDEGPTPLAVESRDQRVATRRCEEGGANRRVARLSWRRERNAETAPQPSSSSPVGIALGTFRTGSAPFQIPRSRCIYNSAPGATPAFPVPNAAWPEALSNDAPESRRAACPPPPRYPLLATAAPPHASVAEHAHSLCLVRRERALRTRPRRTTAR